MNTRRPTGAAGQSWRKWVDEQPTAPLDPDPPVPEGWDELWDPAIAAWVPRPASIRPGLLGLLIVALVTFAFGFLAGHAFAAPRSAQTTERFDLSPLSSAGPTGAPPSSVGLRSAAERPDGAESGAPTPSPVIVSGIASWVGGHGSAYLALPDGRGIRVTICGAGGCWTGVSTDAGPDRSMQRQGRVADLSPLVFVEVCGRPIWVGLCQVTVRW